MRPFIFSFIYAFSCFCCGFGEVVNIDESHLDEVIGDNKFLLAYIRPSETCDEKCQSSLKVLNGVSLATPFQVIHIVSVHSPSTLKVYQSPDEPKLFYYRDGIPLIFESEAFEVEEISEWVSQYQEVTLKILDDSTFEHLTQASSGSTTGDWFILFYSKKCNQYISIWETLAVRLRQHKVVAIVNTDASPVLKKRFSIKKCPTAIFLRSGRMYPYTMSMGDLGQLVNFAEGWYRNVLSQGLPPEPTPFDNLTSNIAAWMKENPAILILAAAAPILLVLGLVLFKYLSSPSKPKLF